VLLQVPPSSAAAAAVRCRALDGGSGTGEIVTMIRLWGTDTLEFVRNSSAAPAGLLGVS
jgi:hypothetical protein